MRKLTSLRDLANTPISLVSVNLGQGYHISRPLPATDFAVRLRQPALV